MFFWELKVGDKIKCTGSMEDWWTEGKLYEVVAVDEVGDAIVINDEGGRVWPEYSSSYFEPVKEGE